MPNINRWSTYWRLAKVALLILTVHSTLAETQAAEAIVTERGPHHREWVQESIHRSPEGSLVTNRSFYTEIETGLHYQKDGEWVPAKQEIELIENGAVARQGAHQVMWSPNINSAGAIEVVAPDSKRMRSSVLGLGLYDAATGQSTLIAEIKDSVGELHPPNQVLYRDAFDGVSADLRYTFRKGGFAQDVIVLERIDLPAGFNEASTRLEVWTEFVEATSPQKTEQTRVGMADETLDFGAMRIGPGKAFSLGDGPEGRSTPVAKRWMTIEGRTFLIEAVAFPSVKQELQRLPAAPQQAAVRNARRQQQLANRVEPRPFPGPREVKAKARGGKIEVAQVAAPDRGLVLDYELVVTQTNFVFQCDKTYYVSGTVTMTAPTFEGGCVIKYANTNSAKIQAYAPLTWHTAPVRPVVFTGRDDHSVGEQIGTNTLSGYYAACALGVYNTTGAARTPFEHLKISHAFVGLLVDEIPYTNRHSQFINCGYAMRANHCDSTLENVLFYNVTNVLYGDWNGDWVYKTVASHVTVHQATNFAINLQSGEYPVYATNSLLVNMGSWGCEFQTNAVVQTTGASVFQTVGAGSHYLATDSPYRNVGTTNLPSSIQSFLKSLTTYPPSIIDGGWPGSVSSNSLTLYPQAQRDADLPDLGFHYQPLDYAIGGLVLTNATLTAMPGVALGIYTRAGVGIGLRGGSKFFSEGTPTALNRIVRYNTVQEQATTNWSYLNDNYTVLAEWDGSTELTESRFRFTQWSVMAVDAAHFTASHSAPGNHRFIDSQFHGGSWYSGGPNVYVTNCLWERCPVTLEDNTGTLDAEFWNNTFFGGEHWLFQTGGSWTFKDNLFAQAVLNPDGSITGDYNAYTTNATRIPPGSNDRTLSVTNVAFQSGWLGRFYLPTNLTSHSVILSQGSRYAPDASLYHYTTATNQTKEGSTKVDIGFHYVAVDSSGQPRDYDGDGLPDYCEDLNGNGDSVPDSGETDWDDYTSPHSLTGTPGLQVFTPLK